LNSDVRMPSPAAAAIVAPGLCVRARPDSGPTTRPPSVRPTACRHPGGYPCAKNACV